MSGHICSPPLYEFEGWRFEFKESYGPPWPVRKDGRLYKRAGDKFWDTFYRWHQLPDREKYRIGGGCERF